MTNRNTLVTAAVLLTVFLAGALVGAAVASSVSAGEPDGPRAAAADDRSPERRPGPASDERHRKERRDGDDDHDRRRGPDYAVSRLLHEQLDLTSEQERRVEAILEKRRERAHEIFDATKSRMRAQFDSAVTELEGVLTDAQAARFDTLLTDLKERRGWDDDEDEDDAGSAAPGAGDGTGEGGS